MLGRFDRDLSNEAEFPSQVFKHWLVGWLVGLVGWLVGWLMESLFSNAGRGHTKRSVPQPRDKDIHKLFHLELTTNGGAMLESQGLLMKGYPDDNPLVPRLILAPA